MSNTYILGISAFYHDSAAVLLKNGEIVAAGQEERFSRIKNDASFPRRAIQYCFKEANISLYDVSTVSFYDKPLLKFERLLETYYAFAPKGFRSFVAAMPVWVKEKLFLKNLIRRELRGISPSNSKPSFRLIFPEHHLSHAASAFYPSPFEKAAILTVDGVGEYTTAAIGVGENNSIRFLRNIDFPHSLGLLYTAFTYYLGFKVNSDEYKVMGLAPYGKPGFTEVIYDKLFTVAEDGSFWMNMDYFNFATGLTMTNKRFHGLFGKPSRKSNEPIEQIHMDIASSIQKVTEDTMMKMARYARKITGMDNLCLAGGVALNCVANGKILRQGIFKNIWIQPAAGDAGGSLGAAYAGWYLYQGESRHAEHDAMKGAYLGPAIKDADIQSVIARGAPHYKCYQEENALLQNVASLISEGKVIGWVQGRMEWGPRALGNRSIIADPRNPDMQRILNMKIKFRESFRPFAPAIIEEEVDRYFKLDRKSPYMLLVADIQDSMKKAVPMAEEAQATGFDALKIIRSKIPAVTHVDYSARVQTVSKQGNPRFYRLLEFFKEKTGFPILINTSFNIKDEPIVCGADDAYRCFMKTGMDYLVINNYLFSKS